MLKDFTISNLLDLNETIAAELFEGKTPTEIAPGTKVYELVEELTKYLPEETHGVFD